MCDSAPTEISDSNYGGSGGVFVVFLMLATTAVAVPLNIHDLVAPPVIDRDDSSASHLPSTKSYPLYPPPLYPYPFLSSYPAAETTPVPQASAALRDTSTKPDVNEVVLPIGTQIIIRDNSGQYSFGFSDNNGTVVSEQGRLLNTNDNWEAVIIKKGFYSYITPDNKNVSVSYVTDENGFRVLHKHVPT
ncbi:hypothetical protein L9F63_009705 [Diploptera punctata]|uniref:Uncharacterized protein n=1 Tax=Diploptera punctata TaxID=6984 RepID=A0AAD8ER05_DIPPU|nr:hypothetical protein L9F63_009705 [Diploptera punctata]